MPVITDNIKLPCYDAHKDIEVRDLLQKKEFSLNAVNNYGDSLLHVSAAKGYTESVKTILEQNKNCNIDRKNKFGWTALMQAIRGNSPQTVKVLIEHGADVTHRTYLGTSALTIAASISQEMFEIIHKTCPIALKNSVHDDISPLCIAAMKNDKELFFKLINFGLDLKDESVYTHLAMQQSIIPEIQILAQPELNVHDYWSDESDNIKICEKRQCKYENLKNSPSQMVMQNEKTRVAMPTIHVHSPIEVNKESRSVLRKDEKTKLQNPNVLHVEESAPKNNSCISPNLIYNSESWMAKSPNLCYSPNYIFPSSPMTQKFIYLKQQNRNNVFVFDKIEDPLPGSPSLITRSENIHLIDPKFYDQSSYYNTTLTFEPEFSPPRSPHLPPDFQEEDVCGENTPTPPHYKTPPRGMVLNSEQAKLVIILKQFDLAHLISTFLAQEVDMTLFLTLTDQDLREIGIANEHDRELLLEVIDAYRKNQ
ncbi:protein phosphatase 1 regulatory subunit 12B-like isoform X2 [Athalia rosae]|uniref:protein phosphatase 1 regulatory subunit 12B-like isoform X2 n=1 Tax=Athalia rosae TaxID=37344 RepID=UPI0020338B41|nr:protein phosphatase 1 regulatory subunit 12B-like isoform X2 [Athalia rosae]